MRFNNEKKQDIIMYILEKIEQKSESVSKLVSETFEINQNTVHNYINELVDSNVIKRIKRGQYELVTQSNIYKFKRNNNELVSENDVYVRCLREVVEKYNNNVKSIWEYAFSEMINNVIDHSNAEELYVIVEENYLNTRVIISDNGIGIFEKIKNYFGFTSYDEAIAELFKGKLTTDSKNHSGEGIFFSSKLMDDFYIVSSGKLFTNNKYDDSLLLEVSSYGNSSTVVIMSLSNYSNKTPQEVFDLYADFDNGFVKTRIPLKNLFDSSPVSRSQAKRLCHRLEKFKEIIIDFDGVNWMGQGFAHQLFVVFKTSHMELEIIPINMNEDVTKMYNHVINTNL